MERDMCGFSPWGESDTIQFDMAIALEIYEALRSVGVEDAKAKSTAQTFDQALEGKLAHELNGLATREDLAKFQGATREDLAKLRGEMREEMAALRGEMRGEMAKLRGEMREEVAALRGEMRGEMARLEARLIKWNVGTIIAVAGLTLAIVKLVG